MKKANFIMEAWGELIALLILIIGFIITIISRSAFITYTISILAGIVFGRIWYRSKGNRKLALILSIVGFLAGALLGALYGVRKYMIVLFFLGFIVSYYTHEKHIIKSIEY